MKGRTGITYLANIGVILLSVFISEVNAYREITTLEFTLTDDDLSVEAYVPMSMAVEEISELDTADNRTIDVYYIVGGMRLGLFLADNALTTLEQEKNPTIKWKFSVAGRVCEGEEVKANNSNCSNLAANTDYTASAEDKKNRLYWEPTDWSLGLVADVTLTYDFNDATVTQIVDGVEITVPFSNKTEEFRIANRTLTPAVAGADGVVPDPMQGSDVKMLEAMLWQLGVSPQKSNPGSEGARINSIRGGTTRTASCTTGQPQRRDTFLSYANTAACTSTELMVKRFNIRHRDTGPSEGISRTDAEGARGTINAETLGWLQTDWKYYMLAYTGFSDSEITGKDHPSIDEWVNGVTEIWANGISDANSIAVGVYTDTIHQEVLTASGVNDDTKTRNALVKAWKLQESPYHWGRNAKNYQSTAYRMTEGGGDEEGSLGFSQVLYKYRYSDQPCTVHRQAGLNYYSPQENMKGFAVHTSMTSTAAVAGEVNCGSGGMYRAFQDASFAQNFEAEIDNLRSYQQGSVVKIYGNEDRQEDAYEKLSKGVAYYNSNTPGFNQRSWPLLLKTKVNPVDNTLTETDESTSNSGDNCFTCRYTIQIRNEKYGLPYRKYIWQGGTGLDLDNDGVIATVPNNEGIVESEIPWCFGYGEQEWLSGVTYAQVRQNASDTDVDGAPQTPVGRLTCN